MSALSEEQQAALAAVLAGEPEPGVWQQCGMDESLQAMVAAVHSGDGALPALPDIASALLRWQEGVSADELVIVVCARLVELLVGDTYEPALDSVLSVASERLQSHHAPEVQAQLSFAQASLASVENGEAAFESPFVRGLQLLPSTGPRYAARLQQFALFLAFRGRLEEISSLLPAVAHADEVELDLVGSPETDAVALRFINGVEAGHLDQVQPLAHALADAVMTPPLDELVAAYDAVLLLWQQRLAAQRSGPSDPFAEDDDLLRTLRALWDRDRRAVFQCIESASYDEVSTASTLFGYQSLRLALALRDDDLAQSLLQRREELGLGHWLDGIMAARIALLRGDPATASLRFCTALRYAEAHDALDRVDFELRLAMELSPMQLVWLGHRMEQTSAVTVEPHPLLLARIEDGHHG